MTLNITVLTENIIYQSADFRLTDPKTHAVVDDHSPKIVPCDYFAWKCFITYTGKGRWRGRDMSEWIAKWLTGLTPSSPAEVSGIISREATTLLNDISQQPPRPPHAFILAAFFEDAPAVFVISNFQNAYGQRKRYVQDRFEVTSRNLSNNGRPVVVVTGNTAAVTRTQRDLIERTVRRYPDDGSKVRRLLAEVNSNASRSPKAQNLISDDCTMVSLRRTGASHVQTSGTGMRNSPRLIQGIDASKQLEQVFKNLGLDPAQVQLVQSASSEMPGRQTSGSDQACTLDVVYPDDSPSYSVRELRSPDFEILNAQAINSSRQILGSARSGPGRPDWIPWMESDAGIVALGFVGNVVDLNDSGDVVAIDHANNPVESGIRWQDGVISPIQGTWISDDGTVCSICRPRAIANDGTVVGSIGYQEIGRGYLKTVPAAFSITGELLVAPIDGGSIVGSSAMAISSSGLVLVDELKGPFEHCIYRWDLSNNNLQEVGRNRSIVPVTLFDNGRALGQARDSDNSIVAVVCSPGQDWMRFGTPNGYAASAINSVGDVVGTTRIDGLQRPWIATASGEHFMLPYARDHNCHPSQINDDRHIVGSASSDHGSHALAWIPM